MSNITFKGFRATSIEFINNHENGHKIEFENKYSYNMKYSTNNTCVGEFTAEINDKNDPEKFHIKAVVLGFFTFKSGVAKEIIHVEAYKELFPYVRALISSVTVSAGYPPVIIPAADIESQSIYRFGNE